VKFKTYLTERVVKREGEEYAINLDEYKKLYESSKGMKNQLKVIKSVLHCDNGEIPVFVENAFYMFNLSNNSLKPVKNRKQKQLCGVLINGLVNKNQSDEKLIELIKEAVNWDLPDELVFISIKTNQISARKSIKLLLEKIKLLKVVS
jgi:hypothetical protein